MNNTNFFSRTFILCAAVAVSLVSFPSDADAQPPAPTPITIDSQSRTAPSISAFQADAKTYRVTFVDGTNSTDVSAASLFIGYATSAYASVFYTGTWSRVDGGSNGVIDFTFPAAQINTNGTFLYFVGANSTYKQGVLNIAPNPYATGVAVPTSTETINMALYTWINGPFVRSNEMGSGATWSGTEWTFAGSGGITTNLKVGAGSSSLLTVSNGASAEPSIQFDDSGLLTSATAASTYSTIASNDGQQAQIDAKLDSNTAYSAFQPAGNNQVYYGGTGTFISVASTGTLQSGYITGISVVSNSFGSQQGGLIRGRIHSGPEAHFIRQGGDLFGLVTIGQYSHGAEQVGYILGTNIIGNNAYGASFRGFVDYAGTATIGSNAYGAGIDGRVSGTATISSNAYGAGINGWVAGTATIGNGSYGAGIDGWVSGTATIGDLAYGAGIDGRVSGTATIGDLAYGAGIDGYVASGAYATNNGVGALQLLDLASGEHALTTADADGSILLGPGTNNVKYSIRAKGGVWTPSDSTNQLGITSATSITGDGSGLDGVVTTINGTNGTVTIDAGSNIAITRTGTTINVASTGGGAGTITSVVVGAGSSGRLTITNSGGPIVSVQFDASDLATLTEVQENTVSNGSVTINGSPVTNGANLTIAGAGTITNVLSSDTNYIGVTDGAGPEITLALSPYATTGIARAYTAFSWGDHSAVGYLTAESDTAQSVFNRGNAITNAADFSLATEVLVPIGNLDPNAAMARADATNLISIAVISGAVTRVIYMSGSAPVTQIVNVIEFTGYGFNGAEITTNGEFIIARPVITNLASGVMAPYLLTAQPTVTVDAVNGWYQALVTTGTTHIAMASKSPSNALSSVRLDIVAGANTVTFATNAIDNATSFTLSTNTATATAILLDSPYFSSRWRATKLTP